MWLLQIGLKITDCPVGISWPSGGASLLLLDSTFESVDIAVNESVPGNGFFLFENVTTSNATYCFRHKRHGTIVEAVFLQSCACVAMVWTAQVHGHGYSSKAKLQVMATGTCFGRRLANRWQLRGTANHVCPGYSADKPTTTVLSWRSRSRKGLWGRECCRLWCQG